MPADPYRASPAVPPPTCERCGGPIREAPAPEDAEGSAQLCRMCFFGQYDLLALVGIGALVIGAATGSSALLITGVLIPGIAAYAIYRGGL